MKESEKSNYTGISIKNSTVKELKNNKVIFNINKKSPEDENLKKLKMLGKIAAVLIPLIVSPLLGHLYDLTMKDEPTPLQIQQNCITSSGDHNTIIGNECNFIINQPNQPP